jgi:hypothetical protein
MPRSTRIAFRQGRAAAPSARPFAAPAPRAGARGAWRGLREIADPELRACLESLAAKLAGSRGPPALDPETNHPIPTIRSK